MRSRAAAVALAATLLVVASVCAARASASSSAASLRQSIRAEVRRVEQAKTTLRFFEHHSRLLYSADPQVKRRAWRDVGVARRTVIAGRAHLRVLRAQLERTQQPIPHYREWLCIYSHENGGYGWSANTGNGYFGGLQMDREFMATYAPWLLRAKGTADHWSPREQMLTAERAWASGRGFGPWPNTARMCGLL